jgi:hypothetical protein
MLDDGGVPYIEYKVSKPPPPKTNVGRGVVMVGVLSLEHASKIVFVRINSTTNTAKPVVVVPLVDGLLLPLRSPSLLPDVLLLVLLC